MHAMYTLCRDLIKKYGCKIEFVTGQVATLRSRLRIKGARTQGLQSVPECAVLGHRFSQGQCCGALCSRTFLVPVNRGI